MKNYGLLDKSKAPKPRREKTESDIVLRHSDVRRSVRESLEARRKDVVSQFEREVENLRRRSSARPAENAAGNSSPVVGEDGLLVQVTLVFGLYSLSLLSFFGKGWFLVLLLVRLKGKQWVVEDFKVAFVSVLPKTSQFFFFRKLQVSRRKYISILFQYLGSRVSAYLFYSLIL